MSAHSIFVVDDEPIIASTSVMILQANGLSATAFTDPRKALQACHVTPPDLLISDVAMPYLSGIELAIEVRKACPNCRILLLSGRGRNSGLLDEAVAEGYSFDLIMKPLPPADLMARVRLELAQVNPESGVMPAAKLTQPR